MFPQLSRSEDTQTTGPMPASRVLLRLLGIGLFLLILYVVDVRSIIDVLLTAEPWPMLTAMFLVLLVIGIRGLRWWLLLRKVGVRIPLHRCLKVYFMGIFFSMVTPGRVGEFGKALMLGKKKPVTLGKVAGTILIDRIWDMGVILLFGMGAALFLGVRFEIDMYTIFLVVLSLMILGFLVFCTVRMKRVRKIGRKIKIKVGLGKLKTGSILLDSGRLWTDTMIPAAGTTILSWLIHVAMAYFIAAALGLEISVLLIIFLVAASTFVALLPISFSGIGTREGIFYLVFCRAGQSPEGAISFSLCFLFVNAFLALIGCVFFLQRSERRRSQGKADSDVETSRFPRLI